MLDLQRYPEKLCLINCELDINVYNFECWLFSLVVSRQQWIAHFYFRKINWNYQTWTTTICSLVPYYWLDKGFKGTVVNRKLLSLNRTLASFEITLTVPLSWMHLPCLYLMYKCYRYYAVCNVLYPLL